MRSWEWKDYKFKDLQWYLSENLLFDQMKNKCRFSWIDFSQVITLPCIAAVMTNCCKLFISVCAEKGWEHFKKKPVKYYFHKLHFVSMEHEANNMKISLHSWLETRRCKIFFRYSKSFPRRKLMFWLSLQN